MPLVRVLGVQGCGLRGLPGEQAFCLVCGVVDSIGDLDDVLEDLNVTVNSKPGIQVGMSSRPRGGFL